MQNINNWGSRYGKTSSLFNLINCQPDINKNYLYANNPFEAKYQLLINKVESLSFLMILKLLLNAGIIWVIFIKISKIKTQRRNVKH